MARARPEIKKVYAALLMLAVVCGFLIINFNDPKFNRVGWVYIVLIGVAMIIYYFVGEKKVLA